MQFNLTGKHLEITPALREYVDNMLSQLDNMSQLITSAQVTLLIEKHESIAEATLGIANNATVHGDAKHEDMYAAIDLLGQKLEKQVQKIKEKQLDPTR